MLVVIVVVVAVVALRMEVLVWVFCGGGGGGGGSVGGGGAGGALVSEGVGEGSVFLIRVLVACWSWMMLVAKGGWGEAEEGVGNLAKWSRIASIKNTSSTFCSSRIISCNSSSSSISPR